MAASPEQRTFKVFISYRRDDDSFHSLTKIAKAAVDQCNEEMPNVHLECFIDRQGIRPGSDWRKTIDRNLVDTDILLAFITEDYCRSEECRYEFNTFPTDRRHIFLPVFWHSPEAIESSLNKGQDNQDAHAVFAEACRRNGISTIAPDVEQMFRDDFGDPVFELRQKIIVLNIAKVVKRLSQYLDSLLTTGAFSNLAAAPSAAPTPSNGSTAPSDITDTTESPAEAADNDANEPDGTNQSSPVFHARGVRLGVDAQAQLIDGVFTVLQGSIIAANLTVTKGSDLESSSRAKKIQALFDRYYGNGTLTTRGDGKTALVTRDIRFTSASSAAAFVRGRAIANGRKGPTAWRTEDGDTGITYGDWFKSMTEATGEESAADEETEDAPKQAKKTPSGKGRRRSAIAVGDDTTYDTIAQVCNSVFGTNYVASPYRGYFQPGTLHDRTVEGYESNRVMAWFPKLTAEDGKPIMPVKDWSNELTHEDDGTYLYQTAADGTTKGTNKDEGTRDVVFGRFLNPETGKPYYRFLGVFANDGLAVRDGKASYRRRLVADSFPIIRD